MRYLVFILLVCLPVFLQGCGSKMPNSPPAESLKSVPQYSGTLIGTTEWHGDVVMAADVRIPAGSRLLIHPGTRVYVQAAQGTKIDPEYLSSATELLIQGELIVNGSTGNPVVFMPVDIPAGVDYGWAGIELVGSTQARITGMTLRNAETGILCIGSSPVIRGNCLSNCRYGIINQQESAPDIIDNLIESGEGGIFCWRASRPVLQGNRILDHAEEGLHIDSDSRPQLGPNVVQGNDIGLYLGSEEIDFSQLRFVGNRVNVHRSYMTNVNKDLL